MDKDVATLWQDAIATLARLSPDARLIRLVAGPGGDPPPILGELASSAIVERFSGREAVCESFRFEVASRKRPFLVTVSMFGGGGWFALEVDPQGIELLELGIEFGGSLAVNVFVARGSVTAMGGIHMSAVRDGPLAFDNAISVDAARTKGIVSPVAGEADIRSCRISKPATCWPSNLSTSPARRRPASCSARVSPSC